MTRSPLPPSADDRSRPAMATSGIGTAIVGLDGRWREVGPMIGTMLGAIADGTAGTLIGRSLFDAVHPDDVAAVRGNFDELVSGTIAVIDRRLRCLRHDDRAPGADGFPAHIHAALTRDADGAAGSVVVQLRDRTPEEAGAEGPEAMLEISRRQLQLFADAVAHDLRAPLRSIESFSSLLADRAGDALDPAGRDHLARIRQAASRMGSLLAALGELSQAMVADLKPGPVDISLLADWVAAELQDAHPGRVFQVRVQPGLVTRGDERLLKLLLTQLLDNAWRFTPEDEPVCIEIDGRQSGDTLHLSVRDHGRGFDMRYLHKLFQPFQRLHGADEGAGHGLGLAIAQCIAERHHGRLRAESEPGAGSTFHLELPGVRD